MMKQSHRKYYFLLFSIAMVLLAVLVYNKVKRNSKPEHEAFFNVSKVLKEHFDFEPSPKNQNGNNLYQLKTSFDPLEFGQIGKWNNDYFFIKNDELFHVVSSTKNESVINFKDSSLNYRYYSEKHTDTIIVSKLLLKGEYPPKRFINIVHGNNTGVFALFITETS